MSVTHPFNVKWYNRWRCILSELPSVFSKNRTLDRNNLFFAVLRGFESEREDAIIHDPFAQRFLATNKVLRNSVGINMVMTKNMWRSYVNENGLPPEYTYRHEFLLEEKRIFASMVTGAAIRTKFFDEQIKWAVQNNIRQIIILNSGFDTRPYRLDCLNSKHKCFSVLDRNSTLKEEKKFYKNSTPEPFCEFHQVVSPFKDGANNLVTAIEPLGYNANEQSLVLFKNLTGLLNESQYEKYLQDLVPHLAKGSMFAADLINANLWGRPMVDYNCMDSYIKQNNNFITADPQQFFKQVGFGQTYHSTVKELNYAKRYSHEPGSKMNYYLVHGRLYEQKDKIKKRRL